MPEVWSLNSVICFQIEDHYTGLQINGGPRSLSHEFKIWPITFQGSGPCGPIRLSSEKISLKLIKIFILQGVYEQNKALNHKW